MQKVFEVTGMTCAACAAHVEKAVKKLGVENVNVNLLLNRMTVDTDIPDADITAAVVGAGYGATRRDGKGADAKSGGGNQPTDVGAEQAKKLFIRFLASLAFLLPLMYFSMGHMAGFPMGALDPHIDPSSFALIQLVFTTPVLVINNRFFVGGAKSALHRSASMDTLVSLGAGAAYIYGLVTLFLINGEVARGDFSVAVEHAMNLFFESAAMILTLVTLGKFLEAKSKGKTRSEVEKLMRLRPNTAVVERDGNTLTVAIDDIRIGDTVIVLPGEYVPCDGVIISGATTLDRSAITGESIPVEVAQGGEVTTASLNLTGRISMRAERVGGDTTLSKIIELIENAGGSKAPIQKIADRVSAVFVPIVCGIALVTLVVWLALGYGIAHALTMGISVLVISCPCALGLATPVAVMAGTGRSAACGVLVKNAETLQSVQSVEVFALDKTATITEGKPRVIETTAATDDFTESDVLRVAASLESTSTHPLARAVTEHFDGEIAPPTRSEYRIGYGVVGTVDGVEYALGSKKLMAEFGVKVDADTDAQTMYLCRKNTLLGSIVVDDEVKPSSVKAIQLMKSAGAEVVMLTGDNDRQAKRIAQKVGIERVYHNVLPEDKLNIVKSLKSEGRTAMVGDGINDAPALKEADVGIAIGSGTDVAIEAADIVLVKSDLTDVPRAMAVSHATLRNIKQNLFWAFIYNTLGIPLAAGALYAVGVMLNPMIAAGAMAFSSLFVVCNALRLTIMRFGDETLPRKVKRLAKRNKAKNADGESPERYNNNEKGEEIMEETIIKVKGMSCMHCVARVEKVLSLVDGVTSVNVSLEKGEAKLGGSFDRAAAVKAVTDAGYDAE